jgi:cell division protein ZapA
LGQVSITIRGRQYQIACDDGQEAHLARLGRYLDQKAEQVVASVGPGAIADALMLVMVSLTVADELADTSAELEALQGGGGAAAQVAKAREEAEIEAAQAINAVSERIERIAASLEGT